MKPIEEYEEAHNYFAQEFDYNARFTILNMREIRCAKDNMARINGIEIAIKDVEKTLENLRKSSRNQQRFVVEAYQKIKKQQWKQESQN